MDKTLVYVGMIVSWIFWIVAFTTYYHVWGPGHSIQIEKGNLIRRNNPVGVEKSENSNGGAGTHLSLVQQGR
jgi:hypothetical protein